MTSRRDFIKLMSAVLGGATLSACSRLPGATDPPGEELPVPSAYTFYTIKRSGDSLPLGGTLTNLRLDAAINDAGSVIYGTNQNTSAGTLAGLYQLTLDFSSSPPQVLSERKIAQQGDLLPNGNVITNFGSYDTNQAGHIALIVESQDPSAEGGLAQFRGRAVYMDRNTGTGPQLVLNTFHVVNDDQQRLDDYIDVSLGDFGDLTVVSRFAHGDGSGFSKTDEGAFYLPFGTTNDVQLVVQSNQMVADTDDVYIQGLGLVDITPDGQYILQARGGQSGVLPSNPGLATMLLQGQVGRGEPALVAASPLLGSGAIELAQSLGGTLYGPRIASGAGTVVSHVVHNTDTDLTLFYNGQGIEAASNTFSNSTSVSPQQSTTIQSLSAPDLAPSGLLYYVRLYGDSTNELVVTNGSQKNVLLKTGDTLTDLSGGNAKTVGSIMFGHTASHIDSAGRIAFTVVFSDATAAVVVGIPQ